VPPANSLKSLERPPQETVKKPDTLPHSGPVKLLYTPCHMPIVPLASPYIDMIWCTIDTSYTGYDYIALYNPAITTSYEHSNSSYDYEGLSIYPCRQYAGFLTFVLPTFTAGVVFWYRGFRVSRIYSSFLRRRGRAASIVVGRL